MKYLAYVQPSQELSTLINIQKHIILPSSGLHTTLCTFHIDQNTDINQDHGQESFLIKELSNIDFPSFDLITQSIAVFDKESIVLKLNRPPELYQLHQDILNVVKTHATPEFNERYQRYFGPKYNPHLTISKTSTPFDTTHVINNINTPNEILTGRTFRVERFYLAKKQDGLWKNLAQFPSSRS